MLRRILTSICRLAANITEYDIISKLILLRIIIPKFMKIRQLFHVKKINMFKVDVWTFFLDRNNPSKFEIYLPKLTKQPNFYEMKTIILVNIKKKEFELKCSFSAKLEKMSFFLQNRCLKLHSRCRQSKN